jgi:hypothetical protein
MTDETGISSAAWVDGLACACAGITVPVGNETADGSGIKALQAHFERAGLQTRVRHAVETVRDRLCHRFRLDLSGAPAELLADLDTARLTGALAPDAEAAVEAEIWLAWLVSPMELGFPNFDELLAQFRVRCGIVDAASSTLVDFHATAVNRPVSHWTYVEGVGFRLNPGKSLAEGLDLALHPKTPEARYAFSCKRASEYVVLLAMAREAQRSNPALYAAMERQWHKGPLMAHAFEAAFLSSVGTATCPAPKRWYVPGDRVWFRNPEPRSADVAGYEGSFVLYLGGGHFANFWKQETPFTVDSKMLEIYCWRFGIETREGEEPTINDDLVDEAVAQHLQRPEEVAAIAEQMYRYQDVNPINADGGAIDYQREVPRFVLPDSCSVKLPD